MINFICVEIAFSREDYERKGKVYIQDKAQFNFQVSRSLEELNLKNLSDIGDAGASYKLGQEYLRLGRISEAFRYFALSCERGIGRGCNNAGFIKHHNLEKKKQSEKLESIKYYEAGRDLGDTYSLYNLGIYYEKSKEYIQSYYYYELCMEKIKNKMDKHYLRNSVFRVYSRLRVQEKEYVDNNYPEELWDLSPLHLKQGKKLVSNFSSPLTQDKKVIEIREEEEVALEETKEETEDKEDKMK